MSARASASGRGWGYAGALLGGLVSVAANVAHSYVPPAGAPGDWRPPLGDVAGAVFWPIALFIAIEILARTSWPSGTRWVVVRFLGLLPVAVVAAVVSYGHLSGLLAHYRESWLTSHLGPLAVDGLMVMASAALMATAPKRAEPEPVPVAEPEPVPAAERVVVPVPGPEATTAPVPEVAPEPAAVAGRKSAPRTGRKSTADAISVLRSKDPEITQVAVAKRLKVTDRTVRKYWADTAPEAA